MSREAVALLKGAGYMIKQKMGKQKFISVFRSGNYSARIRRKRAKLITKLIAECFSDKQITKRLRRHEDLTDLALKVHHIMQHPEYREMKHKDTLRSTIAKLLIDKDHRESAEKVLKENKKRQWPKYQPMCTARSIKDPQTVINTVFTYMDKAWNYERGRYSRNKAGIKFQKAVRDLLSKDWVTNYCLLAGYVPVMKERKLGTVGKIIGETCGCRTFDRFAVRKSFLKKIYREADNYRYHTMKRSLKRIEQRSIVKLHHQGSAEKAMYSPNKNPRPGVWTRVFKGTSSQVAKAGTTASTTTLPAPSTVDLSEKAFAARDIHEISSPFLTTKDVNDVAIKAFVVSPDLPLKLLPARVLTYMELTTILDHPNIIRFIESFATSTEIFVVMPYAPNRSLHHIINIHGRLMQKTAQVWTFHIAMAIQYLHAAGIIHRNIKCSNILITQNYDALLTGFGSAKVKWLDLLHLQDTESSNFHAGYRPYRAPEVLRKRPYSLPPIDVWSLGVVLFRMLNNCFPYCYHNKELMCKQQHLSKWKKTWRRDLPVSKQCLKLLKKMLEPNPAKRIRIDGVVNHSFFANLPIPKAHKKAVRRAAFLLLPKEPKTEEETIQLEKVTGQPPHKENVTSTLEEIYIFLEKMTKPSESRQFQPLEAHTAYKDCYTKYKLRHGRLVKSIDEALRKPTPKIKRPPPPLEYEPYVSDQEKTEIQDQTEAGIHELKKRPEQARKFLQTPEIDNRLKMSLKEVVKSVKERCEQLKVREEVLAKKFALFTPKREASEPRGILTSTRNIKLGANSPGPAFSSTSVLTRLQSKEHSTQTIQTQTIQLSSGGPPLPQLEFIKTEESEYSGLGSPTKDQEKDETTESANEFDDVEEGDIYEANLEELEEQADVIEDEHDFKDEELE